MKLLAGAVLLLSAEQAFAHALLIPFPNNYLASQVLMPTSVVFLVLGSLLFGWGLLTECKRHGSPSEAPPS